MDDSDTLPSGRGSDELTGRPQYHNHGGAGESASNGANMLCVNFNTPLAGAARSERIKQMANNHSPQQPAFEKARHAQEILVKIQTSLRRMPGVSAKESGELNAQLQEVGHIVSQETSQLVDALMSTVLDSEDTDKAIARLSMDATLAKAQSEGRTQTIENLRNELSEEKSKRQEAESAVREAMGDLQGLAAEFKALQDKAGAKEEPKVGRDELIKVGTTLASGPSPIAEANLFPFLQSLEETIKHLEEQVNNRRSLWVMKHSDPHSVARAIETLASSVPDTQAVLARNTFALRSNGSKSDSSQERTEEDDMPPPPARRGIVGPIRPPSVFQSIARTPTAPPSKFSPLQAGPPRAPSTIPFDRRAHDPWAPSGPSQNRMQPNGSAFFQSSGFSRAPPARRGYPPSSTRYRHNAPELQQSSGFNFNETFSGSNGSPYSNGRDNFHNALPPPPGRNRYGRLPDSPSPNMDYAGSHHRTAVLGRSGNINGNGNANGNAVSPFIQMNEQTVATWNAQIMEFYQVIRGFVERHAGIPDSASSLKLNGTPLWHILLETYRPLTDNEAASYLYYHLRQENTKACLVTRVIIDFIVNRVWVPAAWATADSDSSFALHELQRDIDRTQGLPSASRQPLLDRQAAIVDSIMRSDHGPLFSREKVGEITRGLMRNLQPLFNKLANPEEVYNDLELVSENAWELSSKILASRLTFDFRFPEIGSRFSCQSMLPIWPHMDPMELQAKHWRVSLVTTPVITCRNDTGTNISAHSVALADVFCMQ
ncbi:hypothetical protein HJFPF1_06513 [Paramyrothecium foliicola]|nr:hypothetical protein HJFPF1_06513 [Paramyrothecium foliicola]